MPIYGKLNDEGNLEYAPTNKGNILNFDSNIDLLKENGYKEVVDTPRPEYNEFDHYAESSWKESEGKIVREWTILEKDPEEVQKFYNELSMKRGDVFEALILAKGITKSQIRAMIENADIDATSKALYLNRFDEAIDFYRGHPLFDLMANVLGLTSDQLNQFFATKDYKCLVTPTLTIQTVPEDATVTLNGVEQKTISAPKGTEIKVVVSKDGYDTREETVVLQDSLTFDIELEESVFEEIPTEDEDLFKDDQEATDSAETIEE